MESCVEARTRSQCCASCSARCCLGLVSWMRVGAVISVSAGAGRGEEHRRRRHAAAAFPLALPLRRCPASDVDTPLPVTTSPEHLPCRRMCRHRSRLCQLSHGAGAVCRGGSSAWQRVHRQPICPHRRSPCLSNRVSGRLQEVRALGWATSSLTWLLQRRQAPAYVAVPGAVASHLPAALGRLQTHHSSAPALQVLRGWERL